MSNFFRIFLGIGLSLAFLSVEAAPLTLNVQAEGAILFNPDNGKILYEKNARDPFYPASITKIATALWALKSKGHEWNTPIEASGESLATVTEEAKKKSNYTMAPWLLVPGATHMGIKKGEILPFKDLLYGLMVASAGDAANVIAEFAGAGIPGFMKGLNDYIQTLGCTRTHFENPSGLFHPEQKTTAYDMALIMREAMKDPRFLEIIGTVNYTRPKTNKQPSTTLIQANRMLRPGPFYYPKALGGKTGYLALAQNTFVAAAKDKESDRTLIVVLLKSKERADLWKDSIQLFEAAFNQPKVERTFLKKGPQKVSLQDPAFEIALATYLQEDLKLSYYPAEEPSVKAVAFWSEVLPPIAQGQKVGEIRLLDEQGQVLSKAPLLAQETLKGTWSFRLTRFFTQGSMGMLALKWFLLIGALTGILMSCVRGFRGY